MRVRSPFYLVYLAITLLAVWAVFPRSLPAQNQDPNQSSNPSVAEAARKAREEKKAESKSKKVITDDDLDRENFKPGQQGLDVHSPPKSDAEPPNPEAVAKAEATDKAAEPSKEDAAAKKTGEEGQLTDLKEKVAEVAKQLNLLQRKFALDQDAFLSNPNHNDDDAGKAQLDSEQQQINAKLPELNDLKAKLEALEKKLGESPKPE